MHVRAAHAHAPEAARRASRSRSAGPPCSQEFGRHVARVMSVTVTGACARGARAEPTPAPPRGKRRGCGGPTRPLHRSRPRLAAARLHTAVDRFLHELGCRLSRVVQVRGARQSSSGLPFNPGTAMARSEQHGRASSGDPMHPLERPCGPSILRSPRAMDSGWRGALRSPSPAQGPRRAGSLEFRQEQALPALSAQLTRGAAPPAARDVPLHIQMHPPPPHVPPVAWSRSGDADRDGANSSSHSFVAFSPGPGASGTPLEPEGVYAQPWRSGSAREAGPADISPKRYAFSTRRSPLHQIDPEGVAVIPVDARVKRLQKVVDYGTDEAMNSITRRNRWMSVDLPGGTRVLRLNWVVSVLATSAVWATVVFVVCLAQTNVASGERILQTVAEFDTWRLWVSQNFAWLYVASRNAWLFFLVWLSLSKYGSVVLGKQAERPYFDDVSWFAMVVCCGLGMGVWSHGVSTSMALFRTRDDATSLFNLPFQNDDGRAQQAVFMTIYLYGLHAWAVYVLVALAVGVVAYRWDMPVSLRTAFYPLLGDVINGLLGDVIEACAVASTTFAFSTALGFGAEVILAGMRRLDCAFENVDCKSGGSGSRIMAPDDSGLYKGWQVGTMWVISTVVLAAQMLGLRRGIRALAVVTFIAGTCLILILLFLDNSWYILNSIVQAFGHYLHYFVLISFRTDATEQLAIELQAPGAGMANLFWDSGQTYETLTSATGTPLGGKGGADYFQSHGADWMHSYTMFYWAWWVSWAPAVGVFLARISRGRSIRSVVIGALFGPVAYTSVCLVVFASLGIRMQRMVEVARAVPADVDPRSGHTGFINCSALGYSGGQPLDDAAYKLAAVGLYPLACREQKDQVIDLLQPYGPHLARFLGCLTVVVMALYLITALNTASFVHDAACASGMIDTPYIQRSYWALTHVGCATVLVIVGGQPALLALQSLSLSLALPYTLGLSLLCTALLRACKFDDMDPLMHSHTRFLTGLFDWTEGFKPSLARRASPVPVLLPTVWQRVSSLILVCVHPHVCAAVPVLTTKYLHANILAPARPLAREPGLHLILCCSVSPALSPSLCPRPSFSGDSAAICSAARDARDAVHWGAGAHAYLVQRCPVHYVGWLLDWRGAGGCFRMRDVCGARMRMPATGPSFCPSASDVFTICMCRWANMGGTRHILDGAHTCYSRCTRCRVCMRTYLRL